MAAAPVSPASSSSVPQPAPLSQGARIINTFIAPSKTFTDLRRNASWWAPWLVISIFSLIFVWSIGKQVTFDQISKNAVAHSARADQFDRLPADQQARQLQFSDKIIMFASYGSPLLILFYFLIETVALWLTFKFVVAADTTFGQTYAIVMYAALPGVIVAIIGTISMFSGINPEGFDINNPVCTNLAYFLDPDTTGKFVRGLASIFDLTNIWSLVLIGIGFACTSKVKRSTAITIVASWYILYKLVSAGLASLG